MLGAARLVEALALLVRVQVVLALLVRVQVVPLALPPVQVVQRVWLTCRLAHTHLAGLPHLPHRTARQGSRRRGYARHDQPSARLGC